MTDYYAVRQLPNGDILTVMPPTFGRARLTIGTDMTGYRDAW